MLRIHILLGALALSSCREEPRTDKDDITTEWSENGLTFTVKRKGTPIISLSNNSNAFHVDVLGTDGIPDLHASYWEDDAGQAAFPQESYRTTLDNGGSVLMTFYDSAGRESGQTTIRGGTINAQQDGAGQPATAEESSAEGKVETKPESEGRSQ